MTKTEVLDALGVSGSSGKTHCPAHEDDKASLSVTYTPEDKILLRCHAGCSQEEVLWALKSEYGITTHELGNGVLGAPRETARYVYRDGGGNGVFTKIRFHPKDFVIEPAGADTNLLYKLPEILAAPEVKTVLWCEGEKAVDYLTSKGFLATTLGGASRVPGKAVSVLRGRRVVILPDNDEPGQRHAETVARSLKSVGVQVVRILNLPGLPVKGDVVDFFEAGHTPEELAALVRRALGSTTLSSIKIADPTWAWKPRIPATGLTLIFGEAGIGKSTMVLDLIARWTRGLAMPESVATNIQPIVVGLYGCEDDMSSVVVPRLMAAGADLDMIVQLELDPTKPILPNQVTQMRKLCVENGVKVLVLDNIENGMGAVDANNSRDLRTALNPLADFGIPVIAIHHPRKGSLSGSAKEAMTGSQAYTNVARSTMMVIRDEDGLVAFAPVKSNYVAVKDTRTLYFRLGSKSVPGLLESQPVVEWVGGDYTSADNLMARALKTRQDSIAASLSGKNTNSLSQAGETSNRHSQVIPTLESLSVPSHVFSPGLPSSPHPLSPSPQPESIAQVSPDLFPTNKDFTCHTDSKGVIPSIPLDSGNKKIAQWVDSEQRKHNMGPYRKEEE